MRPTNGILSKESSVVKHRDIRKAHRNTHGKKNSAETTADPVKGRKAREQALTVPQSRDADGGKKRRVLLLGGYMEKIASGGSRERHL